MKTRIFKENQAREAAKLIKRGELVAFPTETVYGLGADALNPRAVKKIFVVKGRPSDNPLIVHIAKKEQLFKLAEVEPSKERMIEKLIKRFWPGSLTIILKKKGIVPDEVTCGLDTVAIRMPKDDVALNLIRCSGVPIAAPSANISGKPSGTCFEHVLGDFKGRIAGVIKSKDCRIGLESTVIDLTTSPPVLLRPGAVSFERLKKLLPGLTLSGDNEVIKAKSPGMKYTHYSPDAGIILFEGSAAHKLKGYERRYRTMKKKVCVIFPENTRVFSRNLFKLYRKCDKDGVDCILISSIEEKGLALAIMNRIRKSASRIVR